MVSFSNGCIPGDSANKRPLENSNAPKYKPRKVSAVRDFPAMCGSNFAPTHKKPEQNGLNGGGTKEDLGFKNFESIDAVMANGVAEMAEASMLNDVKKSSVVVGSSGVGNSSVEALCQSDVVRNDEDVDMAEQMDASVEINPLGNEFPKKDTVDNPLEVEGVESLDNLVGNVMMTATMDGFLNDDENLITEVQLVGVDKQNEGKNDSCKGSLLRNLQVQASSPGGIMSKTSTQPKDKYRQRRVSAVRDFPPHCGRFALPPESEKLMVNAKVEVDPDVKEVLVKTSQEECLVTSVNVDVKNESGLLYDGKEHPGEKMGHNKEGESMDSDECNRQTVPGPGPVSNTSNENAEKLPFGREIAASLPDLVWAPRIGFNTGNELCRQIVHALAAPDFQFRKGSATLNSTDGGTKVRSQNLSRETKNKAADSRSTLKAKNSGGDGDPGSCDLMDEEDNGGADHEVSLLITPISVCPPVFDSDPDSTGKEIVVYSPGQSDEMSHVHHGSISADREVVHGVTTACRTPSRKGKAKLVSSNPDRKASGEKNGKENMSWRLKAKAVAKKSAPKSKFSGSSSKKRGELWVNNDADRKTHDDGEDFPTNPPANRKVMEIEISLPPRVPRSSGHTDARNKVRETLRLFNAFCRKLLQQEESISMLEDGKLAKKPRRIDLLSAKAIKERGKEVNTEKQYIGLVPGVEVGDEFQYRVELAIVGIHRLYQAGIDSIKVDGMLICTSIVSSGSYGDDVENADVLLYSGQGGNVVGKCKIPLDQKLEKGNLALYNSISKKNPVRVVRGWKEARVLDPLDPKPKMMSMYVYDGLYTVTRYWPEKGPHGKQVFMFELRRNPGQPELAWKELKKSNKFKVRPGMVVSDISGGKESLPICAVNTFNDEKPPSFQYISKMMYPEWFKPITPPGCDCIGRCTDSEKCRCAVRNGGEVPYNHNGAIVETKPLVYECGPHCKCPPSCYNRVTQRGIKFPLEIFKTESRGWGVRALTSIPSGSFICEYAGELLEDTEAEKRVGSDEYLFDIGHNYSDSSVMNEEKAALVEHAEGGYTIDAAQFGNIGRFINHSCSPNLYAQNVIYDHDDKRMPHVMLFAMENLPPLQELTYHYNYSVDEIRDLYGNIKVKECYCGSAECSGRMY